MATHALLSNGLSRASILWVLLVLGVGVIVLIGAFAALAIHLRKATMRGSNVRSAAILVCPTADALEISIPSSAESLTQVNINLNGRFIYIIPELNAGITRIPYTSFHDDAGAMPETGARITRASVSFEKGNTFDMACFVWK